MSDSDSLPRIPLGPALPDMRALPTLGAAQVLHPAPDSRPTGQHSLLGADWEFEGQARIAGSLTVAGVWRGRLDATPAQGEGHVIITESGRLQGELQARSLSVLGHADGLLQASGRVTLHASAVVSGQVRYGQLQVNGAELNARVERLVDLP